MARVASHFASRLEIVLVDREHHPHHAARGLFFFFAIVLKMTLDVTEVTLDTERRSNESHAGNELIRGNVVKHFKIFENLVGLFRRTRRGSWRRRRISLSACPRLPIHKTANFFSKFPGLRRI